MMKVLTDAALQALLRRLALRRQRCINVRDRQHRRCARIRSQVVRHEPVFQKQIRAVRSPAPGEQRHLRRLLAGLQGIASLQFTNTR